MQTAQAQAGLNRDTAITQSQLAQVNQVTPQGNLSYRQIGTWGDGTPRFEATTSLSPGEQGIYDQSVANETALGRIGGQQIDKIGTLLGTPVSLDNPAVEGRLMDLARTRMDPMWNERRANLETDLANRGIRLGSENYDTATRDFEQDRNDAYNQLLLNGRQQSISEILAERNQPINEITALMSGSQVSNPTFQNTPAPGVAPVDYTGLVSNNYNQQVASRNAMMGGLFGVASAPLSFWGAKGFPGLGR